MSSPTQATSSDADSFLNSLSIPSPDQAVNQLNQTREKLEDTKSILHLLQQTLETTKQLVPAGPDRDVLVKELQNNINRHRILVERESAKLSVKENYVKEVLAMDLQNSADVGPQTSHQLSSQIEQHAHNESPQPAITSHR